MFSYSVIALAIVQFGFIFSLYFIQVKKYKITLKVQEIVVYHDNLLSIQLKYTTTLPSALKYFL